MSFKKLIPDGTVASLRITIIPGGHNDPSQGWTDGLATLAKTGSVYLKVQYRITQGKYSNNKFTSTIGLKSPKGPWWRKKGRNLIIAALNSGYKLGSEDKSAKAKSNRRLRSLSDLNGLAFTARIKTVEDQNGNVVNDIDGIVVPKEAINTGGVARLRQTDLTAKLTAVASDPMWMLE